MDKIDIKNRVESSLLLVNSLTEYLDDNDFGQQNDKKITIVESVIFKLKTELTELFQKI